MPGSAGRAARPPTFAAIDDHARIAFTAIHADERTPSAVQFLRDAVAYYARLGVTVRRLLTDNGSPSPGTACPVSASGADA